MMNKQSEPVALSGIISALILNIASVVLIFVAVDETSKQTIMAAVQSFANLVVFLVMILWTRKTVVSPDSFERVTGTSVAEAFPEKP